MELEHLNEFLVLAERKCYAQSAEELFISQSALSKHIAAMEAKLGVQLFHRDSRSVMLTKYGELLRLSARAVTAEWSAFRSALNEELRADQGGLRIGGTEGLPEHLTPSGKAFVACIRGAKQIRMKDRRPAHRSPDCGARGVFVCQEAPELRQLGGKGLRRRILGALAPEQQHIKAAILADCDAVTVRLGPLLDAVAR